MTTSAAAINIGVLDSEDWNACALPWKLVASDAGLPSCLLGLLNGGHRIADRDAGQQVEGDGDRRELALMVDHHRRRPSRWRVTRVLSGTCCPLDELR